mgnify:CR=1 FL=1
MTGVNNIKEVRHLKYVNGLPIKEIVRRTHLSRNTVRKILRSQQTKFTYQKSQRPQPIRDQVRDKIESWLKEDLNQKPKYRRTAWRMYEILKYEHRYGGSYGSVARCIRELRSKLKLKKQEVFIPLSYSAGEAFQFDWAEAIAYIGEEKVTLQLAIVTLCHSRRFYARAYPCQKQELMLDAHRRAFEHFGGVPRRGIYDNLKTAVKHMLKGNHRNLQERFAQFCSHYLYEPQFCSPAKGNEKGRVENKVGYVRRNFFVPIPRFSSLDELNDRLLSFSEASSRIKIHPELVDKSCYAVYYEEEKDKLMQLPPYGFECCRVQHAVVSPTSTVAFDNNKYSVPAEYVSSSVLVKGYADEVFISCEGERIAQHRRKFGYKQQVLNPYHYLGVLARKPAALRDGLPFKNWKLPSVFDTYRRLLKEKYPDDGDRYFARTLILLKDWSLKEVTEAVDKATSLGVVGDSYVLSLLRQRDHPEEKIVEYLSIKIELARYKAEQMPLSHYDRVLRINT